MGSKIGILGSGIVAKTLANGFSKYGDEVMMGTRDPSRLADFVTASGGKIKTGSLTDAAAFGSIIVLAVKGSAARKVLDQAGAGHLAEKTIIDTTNPIADSAPQNGVLKFFTSLDESLMEQLQKAYPQSNFVKSFSSVGNASMVNPDFGGIQPTMFICGNNNASKNEVKKF